MKSISGKENNLSVGHERLQDQMAALGVPKGAVLLVHAAFSRVRPVVDGPAGLIRAFLAYLGPEGTLVMPSMTDEDDEVFDPKRTGCGGMGVVADTFWRMDGVLRSNSPHAFAAAGRHAAQITRPHPVEVPHGLDSPVGRVLALDGYILMLGINHDANTTIHLAETMAGVAYGVPKYSLVHVGGRTRRVDYHEVTHCCEGFVSLDQPLVTAGHQRRGLLGHAEARLVRSRDVVDAAKRLLAADETAFLHPAGECHECDASREGMASYRRPSPGIQSPPAAAGSPMERAERG